ncbi:hypothetical protein [Escherichia coli]|uniref:hypothetical protein n=1 Tax=Escherichia coli TaxID=562 RepID=UPI0024497884|nr:hypothetical protein [Escherichia coli]
MFHTIVSIKNDGHYFCRAGGNRPDGLNEPVTTISSYTNTDTNTKNHWFSASNQDNQLLIEIPSSVITDGIRLSDWYYKYKKSSESNVKDLPE